MSFAELYRALWRYKWAILLLTAAMVAATALLTSRQDKVYEAETLVRVRPGGDASNPNEQLEASSRLAQLYVEVADVGALDQAVEAALAGRLDPPQLGEDEVRAQQNKDLDLVFLRGRSPDPRRAELVANAVPAALLGFIERSGSQGEGITIVTPAAAPEDAAAPNLPFNLAVALLAGLILNGALALVLEVLRDRLPGPEEIEQDLGVPVLGILPPLGFVPGTPAHSARPRDEALPPPRRTTGIEGPGRRPDRAPVGARRTSTEERLG